MPYPAQINPERVIAKARELVEVHGAEKLSLHQLAAALGVKAPSLYRYFTSKTDLLRALNLETVQQLTASIQEVTVTGDDAGICLMLMAKAWRDFAQAFPITYTLTFTRPELRPDEQLLEGLAIPIQQLMAEISGKEHSLAALRGLWALIHGFILLELNDQFRRGGDLEAAFIRSIEAYLEGWRSGTRTPPYLQT